MAKNESFIDTLIRLFRQLEKLADQVPHKDPLLWQRFCNKARREQAQPRNPNERMPLFWHEAQAWAKYQVADPQYVQQVSKIKKRMEATVKKIDLTLLSDRKNALAKHTRTWGTLLREDWRRKRSQFSVWTVVDWKNRGEITKAIDALEYIQEDLRIYVQEKAQATPKDEPPTKTLAQQDLEPPINDEQVIQGDWSAPMKKAEMMTRVDIDSYKTFNAWAKTHGIEEAGNRQTFVIRLDKMDAKTRAKLGKK